MSQTAKDQVTQAKWANDKAQALIDLHSEEAKVLFNLLTESKIATNKTDDINNMANHWNFYAKPFYVNSKVSIEIQDQAGLLHAHYPERQRFIRFLIHHGLSDKASNRLVDKLLDWQDLDSIPRNFGAESSAYSGIIRNGAVPSLYDFIHVQGVSDELLQLLLANTSINRRGYFNPMTAPNDLLSSVVDGDIVNKVIALRDNGLLTKAIFSELTGIVQDNDIFFYPSNYLSIKLVSKVNESIVSKEIYVHISAYAKSTKSPIVYYSSRG
jgi:general secretion pathway protein K